MLFDLYCILYHNVFTVFKGTFSFFRLKESWQFSFTFACICSLPLRLVRIATMDSSFLLSFVCCWNKYFIALLTFASECDRETSSTRCHGDVMSVMHIICLASWNLCAFHLPNGTVPFHFLLLYLWLYSRQGLRVRCMFPLTSSYLFCEIRSCLHLITWTTFILALCWATISLSDSLNTNNLLAAIRFVFFRFQLPFSFCFSVALWPPLLIVSLVFISIEIHV